MNIFSYKLLIATSFALATVGCATPQGFDSQAREDNWWLCKPLNDKTWDCGDKDVVENQNASLATSAEKTAKTVVVEDDVITGSALTERAVEEINKIEPLEDTANLESESAVTEAPIESITAASVISAPPPKGPMVNDSGNWMVQIGAFKTSAAAEKFSDTVPRSKIQQKQVKGQNWYRVYLGFYTYKQNAIDAAGELKSERSINTWVRSKQQ